MPSGRVVVFEHVTLDGVMQAPGRPDEDRRGGFEHGGWATLWDPVIGGVAEASMGATEALLLGRRTYEDFRSYWPNQTDNPIHPLVLGSGRRLFDAIGAAATLRLVDAKTSPSGVLITTYQPEERAAAKSA
jgi:dihydrofolate reductase